jgi:hypothetical protein
MREFTFKCSIDGEDYSLERLATVRYQRDIHVLHELKRAGAEIVRDGKSLSDDDIDLLGAEAARSSGAMDCFAPVGNDEVGTSGATKQRDGQITKSLSSPCCKNIPLNASGKSVL